MTDPVNTEEECSLFPQGILNIISQILVTRFRLCGGSADDFVVARTKHRILKSMVSQFTSSCSQVIRFA